MICLIHPRLVTFSNLSEIDYYLTEVNALMVKHTQTIRRQKQTNCLRVFDYFMGLAPKGLSNPPSNPPTKKEDFASICFCECMFYEIFRIFSNINLYAI